jgi:hypothetical protein
MSVRGVSLNASGLFDAFRVAGLGRARAALGNALSAKEVQSVLGKAIDVAVKARMSIQRQITPIRLRIGDTQIPGRAAELTGRRFSDTLGAASTLRATREVNEQTSTVRRSTAVIGLDTMTPESASTLTSTAEVNTAPTSYADRHLTFASATTTATLSGVYAGTGLAASATSLKLELRNNTTIGGVATTVRFRVRDQNNDVLFNFNGSLKAGDVVSLGADIGLSVKFTAGTTVSGQFETTAVSNVLPTAVDPDALFNDADLNRRPRFDGDVEIVAGSFAVNGTTVSVFANDSIQTVLGRVSAVVPGITASFAGDRVTLQTTSNSESDIVVGSDTSGFLAAVKLAGATTARGNLRDDVVLFANSTPLTAVGSGSFRVNGQTITVDRDADSLSTVLDRINAAGAGVTAAYDDASDEVVFTPDSPQDPMILDADTSGFLGAVRVALGARGTRVRSDNPFDGSGSSDPLFEPGHAVTAGTLHLNGVAIAVAANDSLDSVVEKINASAAGVVATFDSATERVGLQSLRRAAEPIVLGADTSGFFAATKLDAATESVLGRSPEAALDGPFRDSTAFASLQAGTITVNGHSVGIDPSTMSLRQVVSAVASLGGVHAVADEATSQVRLRTDKVGRALVVEDTSGLLAALGFSKRHAPAKPANAVRNESVRLGLEDRDAAVRAAVAAIDYFNETVSLLPRGGGPSADLRAEMLNVARSAAADLLGPVRAAIRFEEDGFDARLVVNAFALGEALEQDPDGLSDFLESGLGGGLSLASERFDVANAEAAPAAPAIQTERPLVELIRRDLYARLSQLEAETSDVGPIDRLSLVRARLVKTYTTVAAKIAP